MVFDDSSSRLLLFLIATFSLLALRLHEYGFGLFASFALDIEVSDPVATDGQEIYQNQR
ncbi:hypothetical protein Hdeb2414_s0158g00817821 [Helianthus debilis subsp. tardiflorus]